MRRDQAARRPGGAGWDAAGLRSLAIHSAIVGVTGVFVLGALLLAALAGIITGTAQSSSAVPPVSMPPASVSPAAMLPGSVSPGSVSPGSGSPAVASSALILAAPARAHVISTVLGRAAWQARTVTRLSPLLMSTAVDPAAPAAYELVARRPGGTGPFRLWRIGLSAGAARVTGAARRGPAFPVSEVSVAGGFVWVSGDLSTGSSPSAGFRPVLYQVNPRTLAVVASWRLPAAADPSGRYEPISVAAGPARTVWVGFGGTLRQLRTPFGDTVRQVRLPAGLLASDIAVDPAARYLYVAGEGPLGGVTALEYAARTGRLLAAAARSSLRFSVGGAELTAVPGGVWASFRTGMLGQTVLLRQSGLGSVPLPAAVAPRPGVPPASTWRGIYGYAMGASTGYGGGALWLSQDTSGLTGCVTPGTGHVRSAATLRLLADGGELLGVRPSAREVFAAGPSGLIVITAPARCWA